MLQYEMRCSWVIQFVIGRRRLLACGLLFSLMLTGCESTGGRYGVGAGHFDTVVLDAGHGAHDSGGRPRAGVNEKVLALDTSRRIADILRRNGMRVIETRRTDVFLPLGDRVAISNRYPNSVFVSIHYNWARRKGARGIEMFYYSRKSHRLAANILREALRAYPTENRSVKVSGFYVLKNNKRPAVLCELGFVSNAAENAKIQQAGVRQRLAERVAAGILSEQAGREP